LSCDHGRYRSISITVAGIEIAGDARTPRTPRTRNWIILVEMARSTSEALLGLGANEGDKQGALDRAIEMLAGTEALQVVAKSDYHATAPVGGPPGQEVFLNAALRVETTLGPHGLLARLVQIEQSLGRRRDVRWGPRTLDLDLLLYDTLTLAPDSASEHPLELPHPRMELRRFVLESAVEVAADMLHPPTGWTVRRLWRHLIEAPNVAALAGGPDELRAELAARLQAIFGGEGPVAWRIWNGWESDRDPSHPSPKLVIASTDDRGARQSIRARRDGPTVFVSASDAEAATIEAEAALRAMSP
jgi:2-amino-4-hydroxy-6-hydroxymethyldihydropteridine diphosphokinase